MTLQAVNELIASFESAGELSIREEKFLKLAKAYQQLAAENVELKATSDDRRMFIMNGVQLGYIKVPTVETDPALETIRIAVSPQEPTPATDRIVAGIKADAKSHDLDAFIRHYCAELDEHIASGGDQFDAKSVRLRGFIVGGRMFREKLRDEEKTLALREGAK
ncbi:eae-like domain protein [Klebsiella pneumoniae]|nr:eae-like domain protein [Klebsiella pneumoniae]RJK71574.1 eae-like domain protein [Klebsiella pneumoniae]RJK78239.1 eae-like domain protein [Klebsiella pneumoniae]RJK79727.1 eae-like domain protein [Klebsiella pneumoniae]